MGRYARLGTLAIRWTAVGFFLLAIVFLPFGVAGAGMMGMGAQVASGPGMTMGTGAMWWGPMLLNVLMGSLLFALSKPIGVMMAAGLDD